jgi:hypothetical protein
MRAGSASSPSLILFLHQDKTVLLAYNPAFLKILQMFLDVNALPENKEMFWLPGFSIDDPRLVVYLLKSGLDACHKKPSSGISLTIAILSPILFDT